MLIRRPAAIAFAAGLMVIAAGAAGLLLTRHPAPVKPPPPLGVATLPAPAATLAAQPRSASPPPAARPVSLTIPLIGVKTQLVKLGLTRCRCRRRRPSRAGISGRRGRGTSVRP